MNNLSLNPRLQKLVDIGESGLDIMHGELKNMMLEAEENWESAKNNEPPLAEDEYDESDDYHEGYLDALAVVYQLTYSLSFAIGDKNASV